jgi:hypothetical protein
MLVRTTISAPALEAHVVTWGNKGAQFDNGSITFYEAPLRGLVERN